MVDAQISAAWNQAANDLGIRVVAPYAMSIAGETQQFEALLPDFGSKDGALLMSEANRYEVDCWFSILYPAYRQYDRERFMDALNDWGWFGAEKPPGWFKG